MEFMVIVHLYSGGRTGTYQRGLLPLFTLGSLVPPASFVPFFSFLLLLCLGQAYCCPCPWLLQQWQSSSVSVLRSRSIRVSSWLYPLSDGRWLAHRLGPVSGPPHIVLSVDGCPLVPGLLTAGSPFLVRCLTLRIFQCPGSALCLVLHALPPCLLLSDPMS